MPSLVIPLVAELALELVAEEDAEQEGARLEEERKAKEAAAEAERRKTAARARLAKMKAEAAKKAAQREAAEEAAMALEDFTPPSLDDMDKIAMTDGEVVEWLERMNLDKYIAEIAVRSPRGPPHTHIGVRACARAHAWPADPVACTRFFLPPRAPRLPHGCVSHRP